MDHENRQFERVESVISSIVDGKDLAPYCIEVHPTDFCNQACSYCFHGGEGEDASRRNEQLTLGEYVQLFQEAEELGVSEISISGGGEPFLDPNISEILDWLSTSPLRTRIVTNGNFIPHTALSGVLAADEIRFSVDAVNPETYNTQRGMKGGNLLNRTISNIQMLVNERAKTDSILNIGATFLLTDINMDEIEDFAELMLNELGIEKVIYKYDIYSINVPSTRDQLETRLTRLKELFGEKVEYRNGVDKQQIVGPCAVPFFKVAFNPYGELASCCLGSQPGEENGVQLGSLKEYNDLEGLWQASSTIRQNLLLGEGANCKDCNKTDQAINISARVILKEIVNQDGV